MAGAVRLARAARDGRGAPVRAARRRVARSRRPPGASTSTPATAPPRSLGDGYDAVVLHDAALGLAAGFERHRRVWRLHEDASRAEPDALARAAGARRALLGGARAATSRSRPPRSRTTASTWRRPASTRSTRATSSSRRACRAGSCARSAWTSSGPFCLQVLELDRWDDPHAAIDAFRLAKAEEPELQLVLAALLDRAATESWQAAKEISDYAAGHGRTCCCSPPTRGSASLEVGALLLLARAVIERSLREGFELAPFEALWKRTPVVGPGGCRSRCATAWTASSPPEPEQAAAQDRRAGARSRPRDRDGPRRPRAGARALPRDRGARTRAARRSPATVQAAMKVQLPDGTELELDGRRHRRRRRPRDRRGPRARRARHPGRTASCATSTAPLTDGARIEIVTGARRRRPLADPPRRRARARHRGDGALPGREDLDRPADRGRLLLRLRVPRRREALRGRLRAHRGEDARAHQGRRALRARGRAGGRGDRALPRRGPGLQGRADRGPGATTRASRPSRSTATAPSPTSAAARTARAPSGSRRSSSRAWPAPTGAATPTARCSRASTARPSCSKERPRRAPASGSRRRARATTASSAASSTCSCSPTSRPARRSGCRTGTHIWNELTDALARRERRARLHRGAHADPLRRRALEAVGPLARLPRQHVLHRRGGPADGPQAHELPGARADLQARARAPTATCRSATPSRGSCTATSRAARCTACCGCATSPRTTRTSSAREEQIEEEVRALPRLRLLHLRPVRLRAAAGAVDAAREAGRHRGDVGQGRGGARAGAREPAASSTS